MSDTTKIDRCPICDKHDLWFYDCNLGVYIHQDKSSRLLACDINKNAKRQGAEYTGWAEIEAYYWKPLEAILYPVKMMEV